MNLQACRYHLLQKIEIPIIMKEMNEILCVKINFGGKADGTQTRLEVQSATHHCSAHPTDGAAAHPPRLCLFS